MKNIVICTLLSGLTLIGLNYSTTADAKHVPPGLAKKAHNMPPGQAKKLYKNNKVYVTTPQVYSIPANVTIYTIPLVSLNPGNFYFTTQSPAYITAKNARLKGYKTNVYLKNNRWVVNIR